jgi:molybdate transport system substrate-binding protein
VSQALQFVQTGNVEVGIVARSVADVPGVAFAPLDASLYTPLRQSLVVVKGAKQEGLARAFAAFVTGERGRSVLTRYGFALPGEGRR